MQTSLDSPLRGPCLFGDRLPHLVWGKHPRRPRCLLSLSAHRGVDRPDRLEWVIADEAPHFVDGVSGLPRPGDPISLLSSEGEEVMRGRVERLVHRESVDRPAEISVIAYADYERERRRDRVRRFHRARLDEIARAVAADLGLRAEVTPSFRSHESIELRGDPLPTLRSLAAESGLVLAVTRGTLYLLRRLDGLGARWSLDRATDLAALRLQAIEITREESGWRRGRLVQALASPLEPLDLFELRGWGAERDGDYRVSRVSIELEENGQWRSEIRFGEDGNAPRALAPRSWEEDEA